MMKYTQVPTDTFKHLQMNAGIFAKTFDPETGTVSDLICATSGGATFEATPNYSDLGEDIDNVPDNTMELKQIDDWTAKMSGTAVTITPAEAKMNLGAADIDTTDATHITPRGTLSVDDFEDEIWWIGDYSDKNTGDNAGFIAIKMMNVLSTGGMKIKSSKKGKGNFDFEWTAHYSIEDIDTVPFDIYVKAGA